MEESVIVEHRPVLQVCQFFIKHRFYPAETRVDLEEEDKVCIINDTLKVEINMPENVNILKESLSGVSFMDDSLIFRTLTVPDKTEGSFKSQFYVLKKNSVKVRKYKPSIEPEKSLNIYCRFCSDQITNSVSFSRILPLPENFDEYDFFCHGTIDANLNPKANEVLYSCYYFNLHPSLFNYEPGIIHCNNCSAWLGKHESNYVQLWNSTVCFSETLPESYTDVSVSDFLSLVKQFTNESHVCNNKIIMHCDVLKDQTSYLLLWVMDRKLTLLTSKDNILSGMVKLEKKTVSKLLYCYSEKNSEIVDKWLTFTDTTMVKISKIMLDNALKYLDEMSSHIPKNFRTSHDMKISYIDVIE